MCETAASVTSSLSDIQLCASDFWEMPSSFPIAAQILTQPQGKICCQPQCPRQEQIGDSLLPVICLEFPFPGANSTRAFCLCAPVTSQSLYQCIQNFQMVAQLVPSATSCFPLLSGTVVFFPLIKCFSPSFTVGNFVFQLLKSRMVPFLASSLSK